MLGVPSFCRFAPFSPTTGRRYYSYGAHGGLLQSMSYGNGDSVEYSYDALARMENVYYNESVNPSLGYGYAANGALGSLTDYDNERLYVYGYDGLDRLLSMTETSDGDAVQVFHADYDAANRVSSTGYRVSPGWDGALGEPRSYGYSYSSTNGSLSSMTLPGGGAYAYSYDGLRRLSSQSLSVSNSLFLTKEYGYLAGAGTNGTTTLVNSLTVKGSDGSTLIGWSYTYDAAGRITSVSDGVRTWSFVYDTQGQLLSETRDNGYSSQTWTYSYDTGGNLRGWTGGGSSGSYTYGNAQWPDLLTAYNGNPISYDGAGNPTTWYDGSAMTWDKGRQLTSVSGSKTLQFTYSADGLRLTKTVGTGNEAVTHYYTWQGDKLIAEAFGDTEKEFFYDESGRPYALLMRDLSTATPTEAWYYYVTNLQGDVMMLLDANGAEVAHYRYDAWGMMQAMGGRMAAKNPIRYRGYYYDVETKFYYLQSRYYDPKIGRFINADAFASTGQGILGSNMFAYCGNEPLTLCDPRGCSPVESFVSGDENGNNIPDYLEIRWYQQTIRASGQLDQVKVTISISHDGKRCAVDCSVPFSSFERKDSNMNTVFLLDNPLYFYAVCKEVERLVRNKERSARKSGMSLTGSMSFDHIYQELKYHYEGYLALPKGLSLYKSCSTADLNYDEYRVLCLPMYLIEVPKVYGQTYVIEYSGHPEF